MSSLKTTIKSSDNRSVLNTTINTQILNQFKDRCKELGMPMNTCLEAFMNQFVNNDFEIKLIEK